jgi:acetyltransferase
MPVHPLEEILHPKSIAVAGASGSSRGSGFLMPLLEFGFSGDIYPINPKYTEIKGIKVYPSVRDIPGPVDYVISAVPASQVLGLIDDCAGKGVKAIHLFTARFSETGRPEAVELELEILRRAKKVGIRLIGPNCLGVYYPAEGISFENDFPKEPGRVGLASQSGGAAGAIIKMAEMRGIRFSKAISYGNALDFNEGDYLEYFAQDPETDIIMMYIEGVRDGRMFLDILKRTTLHKPVIIIKGGKGHSGARATNSHTGSLAGSMRVWQAMVNQAGGVSATDLEELIDLCVAFRFLPPIKGRNVGVAGGGGGSSVLAADECEAAGLNVIPLPDAIRQELKDKGIQIWDWIGNPVDMSIRMNRNWPVSEILKLMMNNEEFDLLVCFLRDHFHHGEENMTVEAYMEDYSLGELTRKPLLAVIEERIQGSATKGENEWMLDLMSRVKARIIEAGIPLYPNIGRAARSAVKLINYYRRQSHRME